MHLLVSIGSGLLVGGLLGALGAGGSTITVPILIYLLGENVSTAATTSLLIVGVTAASGAVSHWRSGTVRIATALALAGVASVGSVAGSLLRSKLHDQTFLLAFAGVLVIAALLIWRQPRAGQGVAHECILRPDPRSCAKLGAAGLGVGFITGLFGVGGGFAIVAVLLAVLSFPAREAIGTSLVVVALASAMGFVASLKHGSIDWATAAPFAFFGIAGANLGRRLGTRLNENTLRRGFALTLVALAGLIVIQNLPLRLS
jgi:uncharacterized membrane protein YfcA